MGKGYGFRKFNEGIMKTDAQKDYDAVKKVCEAKGIPLVIPKGKTAWKIEDATAEMLKRMPADARLNLLKGLSYYLSLNKSK